MCYNDRGHALQIFQQDTEGGCNKHILSRIQEFSEEFVALRYAIEEAYALRLLLQNIGIKIKKINISSDIESTLKSAAQPKNKLKRRHVDIAYHVFRESYATGHRKWSYH